MLTGKNYKVYADIGPTVGLMQRSLAVLDTVAGPNLIRKTELPRGMEALIAHGPSMDIGDANNRPLRTIGSLKMPVRLGRFVALVDFIVCAKLAVTIILGADYCDKFVEAIYPRRRIVELTDSSEVSIVRKVVSKKMKPKLVPGEPGEDPTDGRVSPKVKVSRPVTVEPGTRRVVQCTAQRTGLVVIQPYAPLYNRHGLVVTNGVTQVEPNKAFHILVANFGKYAVKLQKNQVVAELLPHPRAAVNSSLTVGEALGVDYRSQEKAEGRNSVTDQDPIRDSTVENEQPKAGSNLSTDPIEARRIEPRPPDVEDLDLSHVPTRLREKFRNMLKRYSSMWDGTLGEIQIAQHCIELVPGTRPIAQPPYRAGPKAREVEGKEVEKMLKAGVIEPAQSEWASPVLLVSKPDGSLRFCVDYRKLNTITVKDTYPLPRMDECLDSLGDMRIFSVLDAISGYWQMPIPEEDRDKTAFSCHSGLYRFNRMLFGLTNAPATFQRAMDILLSPFRWKSCLVYLDDIIIFSRNWDDHVEHVDAILSVLQRPGVKLKLRKCEFFVERIRYLGHVVRPGTIEVDQARVEALRKVKHPTTQTQLRSFLGLCNVYRRFVPHYAKLAHPLNQLLKKGMPVHLGPLDEKCQEAFTVLRDSILSPPVLALPKIGLPYSVDTDASNYQIGAALFQTHEEGSRQPIGFFSRSLSAPERNYSVSEKECLAVIWALKTLRPYLYGEHFVVHTDHASLRWLMNVSDPSGRLIRWSLRLSEFDFEVKYKKGRINTQADALSRLETKGETSEDIDEDIPCFIAEHGLTHQSMKSVMEQKISDSDPDSDEEDVEGYGNCDELLALEGGTDSLEHFEAVKPEELLREQLIDPFCESIRRQIDEGNTLSFTTEAQEFEGTLVRTASEYTQVVIPRSLKDRVLGMSHYAKTAGHPGGRKLYKSL